MANKRTATKELQQELQGLQKQGVVLPKNPQRALEQARQMQAMASSAGELKRDVAVIDQFDRWRTSDRGGPKVSNEIAQIEQNTRLIQAMGRQRRASRMQKMGAADDVAIAIPRFYDPLEYWDLSGLPWNMADEGHRHKLHKWLRLYYATHHLIPILIDIFTRFPLVGMSFYCKDKKITEFYEDLFLNDLNYEEFLTNLGREYWLIGEAFPLASFNESLGVWEREELLNPEDIVIENFPLLGTRQIKVVPPEYLKKLATTKAPPEQYKQLEINFPELMPYLKRGEPFPVDDVLLKQVAFKVTDWDDHGTPLMLRGLRTLLHEEKLLASQDAIAERLYSPLILAKLGINNVGADEGPWIPGPDQLESFRDDMDLALSSDFRLMVYHYALEVENVFGREQVPDLWNDFDRINNWLMGIFGLTGILSSGGPNDSPYATSALRAEFMNQILKTFQEYLKRHTMNRMEIVAEAQEHFDYEKRGDTRVPIMEEVVEWDDEGNPHIVEKNKLLVPELEMETLDLRDESTERNFLMALRSMGVPISDERMMVGLNFEFEDTLDEMQEEMIQKTVAQQMAKLQTYKILRAQGLPQPPDLQAEVEGGGPGGAPGGAPGGMPGGPGGMGGGPGAAMVGAPGPMGGGMVMPPMPPGLGMPGGMLNAGAPPYPGAPIGGGGTVPGISNERRQGMPHLTPFAKTFIKTAMKSMFDGIEDEEIDSFNSMTDAEIDAATYTAHTQIKSIEWKKKMRRNARENRELRLFETDDMSMLKVASDEKVVIDMVPPKVRRDILERMQNEE